MNIETLKEILILIAPAVSALAATIIGIVTVFKRCKTSELNQYQNLLKETRKMNRSFDDIAIMKAKLNSIEHKLEEKERR